MSAYPPPPPSTGGTPFPTLPAAPPPVDRQQQRISQLAKAVLLLILSLWASGFAAVTGVTVVGLIFAIPLGILAFILLIIATVFAFLAAA